MAMDEEGVQVKNGFVGMGLPADLVTLNDLGRKLDRALAKSDIPPIAELQSISVTLEKNGDSNWTAGINWTRKQS